MQRKFVPFKTNKMAHTREREKERQRIAGKKETDGTPNSNFKYSNKIYDLILLNRKM